MLEGNWRSIVDAQRIRPSESRDAQSRPSQAYFASVSGLSETVTATDFGGGRTINITHPAMGVRSWFRFLPEEGASAIIAQRSDTASQEVLYYDNANASAKIAAYLRGVGHYRNLANGELDLSSSGLAQTHWSSRGKLSLRGGAISGWLDNDTLEAGFRAPTHRRLLHDYMHSSALIGEERFGLVFRGAGPERKYVRYRGDFAREYVRQLNAEGDQALAYTHEGHVHDADGNILKAPSNRPLRLLSQWSTEGTGESSANCAGSRIQNMIDSTGNVWWDLPASASIGWTTRIAGGGFRIEAEKGIQASSRDTIEINSASDMTAQSTGVLTIRGRTAVNITSDVVINISAPSVMINGRIVATTPAPIK